MRDYEFTSCVGPQIGAYVRSRRASGAICEGAAKRLHLFDVYVREHHAGEASLTQGMVDGWCRKRETEQPHSCYCRTLPVVGLVRFLRARGETLVEVPERPHPSRPAYVPHDFTDDELSSFFRACDAWEPGSRVPKGHVGRNRAVLPVLYRLILSTGIRTCEARLLERPCVDLDAGVLHIVRGKGLNQRLVALHPSMLELMRACDATLEALCPGRRYFFPNGRDGSLSQNWVSLYFRRIWSTVSDERATPYMLRHAYATRTINRLVKGGIDGLSDLQWVSKALGHASVDVTVASYYHIVPALAEIMQERSEDGFDRIVPEASL